MRLQILSVIFLLLITIPAVKSLLAPGGFTSHDLTHHVLRQISMDKLFSEGQFPPRWSGELNNRYGYPVFLFNYPLPALIGEVFYKSGLGYVDSVKAVLFLSVILSVFGMYLFLKSLLGEELAALLGTVFYLYAPIRFVNLYVSGSVGSALALGVLPFVFLGITAISQGKRWGIFVGAVFLAALITYHNVTALMFAPVILGFAAVLIWQSTEKVNLIKRIGIMFLLGLGLSAWFWLPAAIEKQYIRYDELLPRFWADQFPTLKQLIYSPWGYGLSHPGDKEDGLSFQIGISQILVMLVASIWLIIAGRKTKFNNITLFVLITFVFSIFLMLDVSTFVWDSVPLLGYVQFPSRFLAVAVFCASVAAALLIKFLPAKNIIFVALLALVLFANRNHLNINQKFDPGDLYYLSNKGTTSTFGEHLPKWGRLMDKPSFGKVEIVEGSGNIKVTKDQSALVLAEVVATKEAKLRFNQFYFPGWQIDLDGQNVQFDYLSTGDSFGLPVFMIESGTHTIKAQFKNTTVRNIADLISVISIIFMLIYVYAGFKRERSNT